MEAARRVVPAARDLGVRYLSLYTFSTENWNRTPDEVKFLMGLLSKNLRKELNFYREHGIRILTSGNTEQLPERVQRELRSVIRDTRDFDSIWVNLAINYGGRDEILRAVRNYISANGEGCASSLNEETLRDYFDLPEFPEPDLIIRTGGEQRLSNFLLWHCAYSELLFNDKLWPDWGAEDITDAVEEYKSRKRNFGGVR
jgi:undecaprenyl diphosphate synthase